jgi:Fe-S protein assembly chaperone HscA
MSTIQIQSSFGRTKSAGPIVGIDLGTTNSLVAHVRDGRPEVLTTREGRKLIPSVVSFGESGDDSADRPVVGYAAKSRKIREAANTVFSVKRLLGRGFADVQADAGALPYRIVPGEGPDGLARIQVGDRAYTAIEISALILREAKLTAERALGQPVMQAVITVPAYFNDSQRQATRMAGRLAGLQVLRIVNEPTAAALAYGLDRRREGLIAVYDLGGGTFDLSILKLHDGIFEVLATHGDTKLGGDDLDQAIVAPMAAELKAERGLDAATDVGVRAALIEAAESLKIELSEKEQAVFRFAHAGAELTREWTRAEFESLARPILARTRGPCESALRDAGLKASDLSDVVLVGGPTRLKVVQDVAREIFGREPNTSVHPDEVVALGAAIQADILAGNDRETLLLDVVPLTLGIETYGGLTAPLIHRNTRIPTSATENFTTFADNQTGVDIHVLQGERERAEENRSLARFKLRVPPMPAGMARVEVTFLIDADGILQVAAKDLNTRHEQVIEVRPSYGLTDEQVERMLVSGMENVEADEAYRQLIEARNKAEPVLRSTEGKLPEARRLLPPDEVRRIEERAEGLRVALRGTDVPAIQESARALNESTVKLAELLLKDALNRNR